MKGQPLESVAMDPTNIGKWIIVAGLCLAALGALVWLLGKWGLPFGSLPVDIRIDRPGFSFRFPLGTAIILSVVITLLLNIMFWFFRK